jgi:hypothetical protein
METNEEVRKKAQKIGDEATGKLAESVQKKKLSFEKRMHDIEAVHAKSAEEARARDAERIKNQASM